MEIERKTSMPNIIFRNGVTGLGWTIADSQRDGETDLEKSCSRIEKINKVLIKKLGIPGKKSKREREEDEDED